MISCARLRRRLSLNGNTALSTLCPRLQKREQGGTSMKETDGISRRNFVTGAGAVALTMAAASLAACSPETKSATTEPVNKTEPVEGLRWSWENGPIPIPETEIVETIDTELCVVGLGVAGVAATLAAAKSGAKVTVVQKSQQVQTNGWCAAAYNSKRFLEAGRTYNIPEIKSRFLELACGRNDGNVVDIFFKRSGEVLDFLIDNTPEKEPVLLESGHTYGWYINNDMATRYDQFRELLGVMVEKAVSAGADIHYGTPAVQLVKGAKGIEGVIAQQEDGSYIKVKASKGVILATGDISDDKEMLECFAPHIVGLPSRHTENCNTGDGHKMGLWVGAAIDKAPHGIMVHFDPTTLPEGNAPYSGIPWLKVNQEGQRFSNENMGYQSVVTAVALQSGHIAYQITDANWAVHASKDEYTHDNSHSRHTTNPEKDWQSAIERGAIIQADTLEELAAACSLPEDTFLMTVKRYNELCEKGVDEDYGVRGDYLSWNAIKTAPFFAIKRAAGILSTIGGLKINNKLQVLDEVEEPISGLYAAGNASGSYYGYDYPLFVTGGSNGRAFTFGALAARSAIGKLDEPLKA
jgi:succinate dehydrogenase/fumarate reductase flavoprotein subunit